MRCTKHISLLGMVKENHELLQSKLSEVILVVNTTRTIFTVVSLW